MSGVMIPITAIPETTYLSLWDVTKDIVKGQLGGVPKDDREELILESRLEQVTRMILGSMFNGIEADIKIDLGDPDELIKALKTFRLGVYQACGKLGIDPGDTDRSKYIQKLTKMIGYDTNRLDDQFNSGTGLGPNCLGYVLNILAVGITPLVEPASKMPYEI